MPHEYPINKAQEEASERLKQHPLGAELLGIVCGDWSAGPEGICIQILQLLEA